MHPIYGIERYLKSTNKLTIAIWTLAGANKFTRTNAIFKQLNYIKHFLNQLSQFFKQKFYNDLFKFKFKKDKTLVTTSVRIRFWRFNLVYLYLECGQILELNVK